MRVAIDLKRGENAEVILNNLYKQTNMEATFGINMLAIVDGRPRTLTLTDVLWKFVEHRREVIRRRTEYDLKKAETRAHILEGLRVALDNLDAAAARALPATALERDAVDAWQEALKATARQLEAAWLALEQAIETEEQRWRHLADDIAAEIGQAFKGRLLVARRDTPITRGGVGQGYVSDSAIVEMLKIVQVIGDGNAVFNTQKRGYFAVFDDTLGLVGSGADGNFAAVITGHRLHRINQFIYLSPAGVEGSAGRDPAGEYLKVSAAFFKAGYIHVAFFVANGKVCPPFYFQHAVAMRVHDDS